MFVATSILIFHEAPIATIFEGHRILHRLLNEFNNLTFPVDRNMACHNHITECSKFILHIIKGIRRAI